MMIWARGQIYEGHRGMNLYSSQGQISCFFYCFAKVFTTKAQRAQRKNASHFYKTQGFFKLTIHDFETFVV